MRCSEIPSYRAWNGGQRPAASCTRFSPKTRWPCSSTAATRAAGCTLETAISVTLPGARPAAASACLIRAVISFSPTLCLPRAIPAP